MTDTKVESVFDIPADEAAEARLDAIADAEIDAGAGVPHDKVRAWLRQLGKGEKVPPPRA
jgi:predicted transcriptional regulator